MLRVSILCILYDRRRTHPYTPTLSMRALENIVAASNDELMVALWYLKQRNLVINDDKSSLQITVDGLDFLEEKVPNASVVMPMIKPAFIDVTPVHAEPAHVEAVKVEESRANRWSRSRSRRRLLLRRRSRLRSPRKPTNPCCRC